MFKKVIIYLVSFVLFAQQSGFAQVVASLPATVGTAVEEKNLHPVHLRYLELENNTNDFQFLVDKGDYKYITEPELKLKSQDLLKYFFIGLALPKETLWVNLRQDQPDKIIDNDLASTDIGKIFLEADLQLKKDLASYLLPNNEEGKIYWDKVYKRANELFGTEKITIPTLNRPWIVPDEVLLRDAGNSVYIYKATLKVMLESDHLKDSKEYNFQDSRLKYLNEYSSQIIKEQILPKLNKEINTGKKYSQLRQVYYSLILAQWFKMQCKSGSIMQNIDLSKGLLDSRNLENLVSKDIWSKEKFYADYKKSFENHEFSYQSVTFDGMKRTVRQYFSGGFDFTSLDLRIQEGIIKANNFIANIFDRILPSNTQLFRITGSNFSSIQSVLVKNSEKADDGGTQKEYKDIVNSSVEQSLKDFFVNRSNLEDLTALVFNNRSYLNIDSVARNVLLNMGLEEEAMPYMKTIIEYLANGRIENLSLNNIQQLINYLELKEFSKISERNKLYDQQQNFSQGFEIDEYGNFSETIGLMGGFALEAHYALEKYKRTEPVNETYAIVSLMRFALETGVKDISIQDLRNWIDYLKNSGLFISRMNVAELILNKYGRLLSNDDLLNLKEISDVTVYPKIKRLQKEDAVRGLSEIRLFDYIDQYDFSHPEYGLTLEILVKELVRRNIPVDEFSLSIKKHLNECIEMLQNVKVDFRTRHINLARKMLGVIREYGIKGEISNVDVDNWNSVILKYEKAGFNLKISEDGGEDLDGKILNKMLLIERLNSDIASLLTQLLQNPRADAKALFFSIARLLQSNKDIIDYGAISEKFANLLYFNLEDKVYIEKLLEFIQSAGTQGMNIEDLRYLIKVFEERDLQGRIPFMASLKEKYNKDQEILNQELKTKYKDTDDERMAKKITHQILDGYIKQRKSMLQSAPSNESQSVLNLIEIALRYKMQGITKKDLNNWINYLVIYNNPSKFRVLRQFVDNGYADLLSDAELRELQKLGEDVGEELVLYLHKRNIVNVADHMLFDDVDNYNFLKPRGFEINFLLEEISRRNIDLAIFSNDFRNKMETALSTVRESFQKKDIETMQKNLALATLVYDVIIRQNFSGLTKEEKLKWESILLKYILYEVVSQEEEVTVDAMQEMLDQYFDSYRGQKEVSWETVSKEVSILDFSLRNGVGDFKKYAASVVKKVVILFSIEYLPQEQQQNKMLENFLVNLFKSALEKKAIDASDINTWLDSCFNMLSKEEKNSFNRLLNIFFSSGLKLDNLTQKHIREWVTRSANLFTIQEQVNILKIAMKQDLVDLSESQKNEFVSQILKEIIDLGLMSFYSVEQKSYDIFLVSVNEEVFKDILISFKDYIDIEVLREIISNFQTRDRIAPTDLRAIYAKQFGLSSEMVLNYNDYQGSGYLGIGSTYNQSVFYFHPNAIPSALRNIISFAIINKIEGISSADILDWMKIFRNAGDFDSSKKIFSIVLSSNLKNITTEDKVEMFKLTKEDGGREDSRYIIETVGTETLINSLEFFIYFDHPMRIYTPQEVALELIKRGINLELNMSKIHAIIQGREEYSSKDSFSMWHEAIKAGTKKFIKFMFLFRFKGITAEDRKVWRSVFTEEEKQELNVETIRMAFQYENYNITSEELKNLLDNYFKEKSKNKKEEIILEKLFILTKIVEKDIVGYEKEIRDVVNSSFSFYNSSNKNIYKMVVLLIKTMLDKGVLTITDLQSFVSSCLNINLKNSNSFNIKPLRDLLSFVSKYKVKGVTTEIVQKWIADSISSKAESAVDLIVDFAVKQKNKELDINTLKNMKVMLFQGKNKKVKADESIDDGGKGGIDWTQMLSANGQDVAEEFLPQFNKSNKIDLKIYYQQIQAMIENGIVPNFNKVQMFVSGSFMKPGDEKQKDLALKSLMDVLKLLEFKFMPTDKKYRDLLYSIEDVKSSL